MFDVIVLGGGAAGFYGAIHIAQGNPRLKVAILEKGKQVLSKVRVSGGGRCNVTHAEFTPSALVKNYPRGEKELLGPFHTHSSGDTVAFFEDRDVRLKTEEDGRMFPVSNSSETIIDCLTGEAEMLGIFLLRNSAVKGIDRIGKSKEHPNGGWRVVSIKKAYFAEKILVATGSSTKVWKMMEKLGHRIVPPVPSLFTFNCKDPRISGIPGISTMARVDVLPMKSTAKQITVALRSRAKTPAKLTSEGPLLITHWGFSGPAILRLSAWGALLLSRYNYKFRIRINWLPEYEMEGLLSLLMEVKEIESRKTVMGTRAVDIPRRLWINMVKAVDIPSTMKWAEVRKNQLETLAHYLTASEFAINGKSTFKEEFVTAGGIDLKEINFKTFESRLHPNLYFAGEVINVDAITGGFNFQNAWTGAFIAAKAITTAKAT